MSYRLLAPPKYTRRRPGVIITMVCRQCGSGFDMYECLLKYGRGKFCCLSCRVAYAVAGNNPNWRGGDVEVRCDQCGVGFSRAPAFLRRSGRPISRHYCSVACKAEWQRGRRAER